MNDTNVKSNFQRRFIVKRESEFLQDDIFSKILLCIYYPVPSVIVVIFSIKLSLKRTSAQIDFGSNQKRKANLNPINLRRIVSTALGFCIGMVENRGTRESFSFRLDSRETIIECRPRQRYNRSIHSSSNYRSRNSNERKITKRSG